MKTKVKVCELCNKEANLYCNSDAAFLCFDCDSKVHNANFLVARHIRRLICFHCKSLAGNPFSGTRSPTLLQLTCRSCSLKILSSEEMDSISSSSSSTLSSACISSTDSQTLARGTAKLVSSSLVTEISGRKKHIPAAGRFSGKKLKKSIKLRSVAPSRMEAKRTGIFANWCKRLGLNSNLVMTRATRALGLCLGRLGRVLPFRVSLAASFWFGVRLCGDKSLSTWQNLRRLEEVSGVPAKLIMAVEIKLEHVLRVRRSRSDLKEGWAECSV